MLTVYSVCIHLSRAPTTTADCRDGPLPSHGVNRVCVQRPALSTPASIRASYQVGRLTSIADDRARYGYYMVPMAIPRKGTTWRTELQ
jgi:hypothetical protein